LRLVSPGLDYFSHSGDKDTAQHASLIAEQVKASQTAKINLGSHSYSGNAKLHNYFVGTGNVDKGTGITYNGPNYKQAHDYHIIDHTSENLGPEFGTEKYSLPKMNLNYAAEQARQEVQILSDKAKTNAELHVKVDPIKIFYDAFHANSD